MRSLKRIAFFVAVVAGMLTPAAAFSALNDSVSVKVTVNDAPPTVTIQAPIEGETLSATYDVTVSAIDDSGNVSKVEFYLDTETTPRYTDTTSPYVWSVNTASFTNGTHTIKVIAYDPASHTTTATVKVTFYNSSVIQQPSLASVNGYRLSFQKRKSDGTLEPAVNYNMKGICWTPASQCMPGDVASRRSQFSSWADKDTPLMQSAYINTARTYIDFGSNLSDSSIVNGLATLDKLYNKGIMVVMGVDVDGHADFTTALKVVKAYKKHPAILMWAIGNEWNINHYWNETLYPTLDSAAQATQQVAQDIKALDSNHPVATIYGDITYPSLNDTKNVVNTICTAVDVWGLNLYRGNSFGDLFTVWKANFTKPIFISEYGTDSYHTTSWDWGPPIVIQGYVDEAMQSGFDALLVDEIKANLSADSSTKVCLGGTPFAWNDEWWKAKAADGGTDCGQENLGFYTEWNPSAHPDSFANEEYFGIVQIGTLTSGRPTKAAYTMLKNRYDPNPQPTQVILKAASLGANGDPLPYRYGWAKFYRDGNLYYDETGGGGDGRGVNVSVLNPTTGEVEETRRFDTWLDLPGQSTALANYINGLAAGKLVMCAVCDTAFPINQTLGEDAKQALEQRLGSAQVRSIVFRGSWALISRIGTSPPAWKQEGISDNLEVVLEVTVPLS